MSEGVNSFFKVSALKLNEASVSIRTHIAKSRFKCQKRGKDDVK